MAPQFRQNGLIFSVLICNYLKFVVLMPNITTNHAVNYTNLQFMKYISACFDFRDELLTK